MSGLEALGAACAIFQTISFAQEVTSLCYGFYSEAPVAYDTLQQNADAMATAAASIQGDIQRLQNGTQPSNTQDLVDLLQRVHHVAQELSAEVTYVLAKRQPGSIFAAARTHLCHTRKRSAISTLRATLDESHQATQMLLTRYNM